MSGSTGYRWTRMVVLAIAVGALTVTGARADEKVYRDQNLAITVPEGWDERPVPNQEIMAMFASPDGKVLLILQRDAKGEVLDDAFIADLEKGIEAGGGGKRLSSRSVEVQGLPGYERVSVLSKGDSDVSIIMRVILANGKVYAVQGIVPGRDAAEDPVIREVLESFRFLRAPEHPVAKSEAYKLGEKIGRAVGIGLVLLVVAGFLVGIALCLYFLVRKTGGRPRRKRR